MKNPHAIVEHEEQEYLLIEEGYNEQTRAVAILTRTGNPQFPRNEATPLHRFRTLGEWQAVARWTRTELVVADEGHVEHAELLRQLATAHIEQTPRPPPLAWALRDGEGFAGSLTQAVPMGVVVHCYDDEERAHDRAAGRDVVPIDNLPLFFNHMVRLGFAGGLWNEEMPVFFCVDEADDLQYLRLRRSARDEVALEILDAASRWQSYEGEEDVEFLENTEACDQRLVEMVGRRPVLEWPGRGRLHSVGPHAGDPAVMSDEGSEVPHGVLFTTVERAQAFRSETDPTWTIFPVDDAETFLKRSELSGCVVQLNPGSHRAYTGTLWNNGEHTVLDSFSGFWRLRDDDFEPAG